MAIIDCASWKPQSGEFVLAYRYFDLQGRQLSSDKYGTSFKGLYIENGKKHINK